MSPDTAAPPMIDLHGPDPNNVFKWIGNARSALGLGVYRGSSLLGEDLLTPPLDLPGWTRPELRLDRRVGQVRLRGAEVVAADWLPH